MRALFLTIWLILIASAQQSLVNIQLDIKGEFPIGESIVPDVAELNGKDIRQNFFLPGKYQLKIAHPGYIAIEKEVTILNETKTFLIQEILSTKPRKVVVKITYDLPPPKHLAEYKIIISPLDKLQDERKLHSDDMIKPNSYLLKITKPAYEIIKIKLHVFPDERPFILAQKLFAKQVPISANITRDVPAPDDLPPHSVLIFPHRVKILLMAPERIRPGTYDLEVSQPGYYTIKKEFTVLPSEKNFVIREKLIAKKRTLSFDFVKMGDGCLQEACKVINVDRQEQIGFRDEFKPGQKLHLLCKFKHYEDYRVAVVIPPGEGSYNPLAEGVALKHLQPLVFTVAYNQEAIDDILYEYTFSVDGQFLEEHHVKKEKGIGRFYYTIMAKQKCDIFRAYIGYKYTELKLQKFRSGMMLEPPGDISCTKLIEHLRTVRNKYNDDTAIGIVIKLLKNPDSREMLKRISSLEVEQLVKYLKTWKLLTSHQHEQVEQLIDNLNTLK